MSKFKPTLYEIKPSEFGFFAEHGLTLKGYIWAVSCSDICDGTWILTIEDPAHIDDVIELEVLDEDIFDMLRQHMFTNNLIEFRGYVEVEQGYNDCAYNTYIVKSFEALNHE